MKDSVLQLALREMLAGFRHPVQWAILLGAGVVLAMAGAFETDAVMRPVPRLIYWIGIVAVTYAAGSAVNTVGQHLLQGWPRWVRVGITGVTIGLFVFAIVVGVNTAIFGPVYDNWAALAQFAGTVGLITVVVTIVLELAFSHITTSLPPDTSFADHHPTLLDRLPFDKRGDLVSISVEDHYVRVRTTGGEGMILMRLSDAIRETTPVDGVQVHRSHWVASEQITSATRAGGGATLTLTHGPDIPVSRANLPTLREKGLLP